MKEPIQCEPTYSEEGDKKSSGMFIRQNGGPSLKWFYKNETPHDRPPMEQITFKGETVWDDTKQTAFYVDLLLNKIRPQLDAAALEVSPQTVSEEDLTTSDLTAPEDDLPF